ncbi:MAG: ttgA, partial [Planctomycetaceae bacterium]|nr:ttgA [Planctomycetaceae bacterium]
MSIRGTVPSLRWSGCGVCLLLVVLTSGCQPAAAQPTAGPTAPSVRVVPLVMHDVVDFEHFTGRTDAIESVEVKARVTGYLMEIGFKPGDEVKKGQVLFKVDPRRYQAEVDRDESQVLMSQARLKLADSDMKRANDIIKTPGALSRQEADRYISAQSEALASLKSAQAMVEMAKLNLSFTEVVAPITGQVGRNLLTVGNLVVQDETLLTTIVSEDPIFAYFDVDERTMLRLQKGIQERKFKDAHDIEIRFGLANEQDRFPHVGKLDFVNNRINASTGTLQMRAVISNPVQPNGGLRLLTPGMFLRVRLAVGDSQKGLVIPQAAIGSDQSRKFIHVVTKENKVEYRPVKVGPIQPDGRQLVEPIPVVRDEQ